MTTELILAYRWSAVVHIGLLVGLGIAVSATTTPPHVHHSGGEITIVSGFAAEKPAEDVTQDMPIFAPDPSIEPRSEPVPEMQASEVKVERASAPRPAPLVATEMAKPLEDHEDCDCWKEVPVERRNAMIDSKLEPQPVSPSEIRRTAIHLQPSVATSVTLPTQSEGENGVPDQPPTLAFNRPPPYPADAYQNRLEGRVLLEAQVNGEGVVESLRILESSGVPSLDAAALTAVRSWRFEPARRAGRAVPATVNVPVRFALRGR